MTLWIDRLYANRLAPQLARFKWKNQQKLASFRCPFCGDSATSQTKTRGYFYEFQQELHFKCHNCNQANKFSTVLKKLDPALYNEYRLDCLRENGNPTQRYKVPVQTLPIAHKANLGGLPSIASLPADHIARQFVVKRQLPVASWEKLFYTDTWSDWVTAQNWDHEYKENGIPRILMPCYNIQGGVMMVQSRSLLPDTPQKLRYLTAKAHTEVPKVYGLERWDVHQLSYVVEGPFDSWFLPNCLAAMGSELGQVPSRIPTYEVPEWVFVPDREPRNKQIVAEITKIADEGYAVCLLPDAFGAKDLNEFIMSGHTPAELLSIVEQNTFSGIRLHLELSKWKRL